MRGAGSIRAGRPGARGRGTRSGPRGAAAPVRGLPVEKGEGTSHAHSQQAHAIKPHPQTIVISFLGFRLYWDEAQRRQHARPGAGGHRERPRGAAGRGGPALSFRSRPPYSPSPGPACRAAQAAPLDGFPGEAGAAAGRGGVERRRAGAGGRAPLFCGPSFQPLSAKAARPEARRLPLEKPEVPAAGPVCSREARGQRPPSPRIRREPRLRGAGGLAPAPASFFSAFSF